MKAQTVADGLARKPFCAVRNDFNRPQSTGSTVSGTQGSARSTVVGVNASNVNPACQSHLCLNQAMDLKMPLTAAATLGCGLMAGLFCTFSNVVMKALGRLPPQQGMAAMQEVNLVIVNPLFLAVFFGTAATVVALSISVFIQGSAATLWQLAGAILYLVGCLCVTVFVHIPRNNALSVTDAASPDSVFFWRTYLSEWTTFNHLRSAAGCSATVCFIRALIVLRNS